MPALLLGLISSWILIGTFRAVGAVALNHYVQLGLHRLALLEILSGYFAPDFLTFVLAAGLVVVGAGWFVLRLMDSRGEPASRLSLWALLAVFWAALSAYEIADKTAFRSVMTSSFVFSPAQAGIAALALVGFLASGIVMRRSLGRPPLRAMAPIGVLLLVIGGAGAALAAASRAGGQAPDRAPNLVLVTIDTLRADHLSVYGYSRPTSPRIDGLAAGGALYTEARSQAPNTHPSMASLHTSLYPNELGHKSSKYIPYGVTTLAEALRNRGYRTAAVVSNVWLKSALGFDQGFEHYDESSAMSEFYGEDGRIEWKNAAHVTDAATAWLRARPEGPFFLWVHYLDPHHPYEAAAPYDTMFGEPSAAAERLLHELERMSTHEQTKRLGRIGTGDETVSEAEFQAIVDQYDAEIRYTDDQIGRLLDALQEDGALENAAIVLTADHGEEFRDHGAWGHGHTLHRELLHVPLVVRDPRESAPRSSNRVVRLLDVAPTLLNIAGTPIPGSMRGRDLSEAPDADRPAVSLLTRTRQIAIEAGGLKAVLNGDLTPVGLFDLSQDRYEMRDLSASAPDRLAAMQAALSSELDMSRAAEATLVTAEGLDKKAREQLEALGYLE